MEAGRLRGTGLVVGRRHQADPTDDGDAPADGGDEQTVAHLQAGHLIGRRAERVQVEGVVAGHHDHDGGGDEGHDAGRPP